MWDFRDRRRCTALFLLFLAAGSRGSFDLWSWCWCAKRCCSYGASAAFFLPIPFHQLSAGRSIKQRRRQHSYEAPLRPHTNCLLHSEFLLHVSLNYPFYFSITVKSCRLHLPWNSRFTRGCLLANGHWDRLNLARNSIVWNFIYARIPSVRWVVFMRFTRFNVTPRWLAKQGQLKKAERSIARSYGIKAADENTNHFVQAEVKEIADQIETEKSLKAGWVDCFKPANKTLYRTLLGMSLQSLQQLTGANYFFYYGATIFQSVGIQDSFITQIILGAVNFGCTFGGLYVMERVRSHLDFPCVFSFILLLAK